MPIPIGAPIVQADSGAFTSALRAFFAPAGVAVIGASATPGKLGYGVLQNLVRQPATGTGYQGRVYPVNPHAQEILGVACYSEVSQIPDPVDLAVIIVAAPAAAAALAACGRRGIPAAIVLSGGFAESGPEGAERQAELVAVAKAYGIRLIGPNCVGVLDAHSGLNVTFIEQMPDPGLLAFISQSGAVGGALIDWTKGQGLGLSIFASLGNTADINESDLLTYLADDPRTGVIALYIEGLLDGRRFVDMASQTARRKPVIALKVGGTEAGARAIFSHTASLAGAAEAYRAAFRQAGVTQAESTEDLFGMAMGMAYQPLPTGDRVAILTNAGGPGAIAADALARGGLRTPPPAAMTQHRLRQLLGSAAQLANPIDMLGAASSPEYEAAAQALLDAPEYDALFVILVPNTANHPADVADALARAAQRAAIRTPAKPIYACFMGDISVQEGRRRLHQHQIPPFTFPEPAARALAAAWNRQQWLAAGAVAAARLSQGQAQQAADQAGSRSENLIVRAAAAHFDLPQRAGPQELGENDLYPVLRSLGFPVAPSRLARSAAEAANAAAEWGTSSALKIASPDLVHKSDAGGVRLNVLPEEVTEAYVNLVTQFQTLQPNAALTGVLVQQMAAPGVEMIVGMRRDPVFGPLVLCGGGGVYVEALGDIATRLAPLTPDAATAMIAETVAGRLLQGHRGRGPADIAALADLLCRVSDLALAVDLAELEFNPVIVHPAGHGVTVVDVRARF